MFKIKQINLPPGYSSSIRQINPYKPVNLGDRLGPEGQEYLIEIHGLGVYHLKDIGSRESSSKTGEWGIKINNDKVWYYNNDGEMSVIFNPENGIAFFGGGSDGPYVGVNAVVKPIGGTKLSDLSQQQYGYDFVVSTTQESINATLKHYLNKAKFTAKAQYYVFDQTGRPMPIATQAFLARTGNLDPLTLPSWNGEGTMSPALKKMEEANFAFAFALTPGLPKGLLPLDMPDILTLQSRSYQAPYSMVCEKITVVEFTKESGKRRFNNIKQPVGGCWKFTALAAVGNANAPDILPEDVKQAYDALVQRFGPKTFSVQQLIVYLNDTRLQHAPAQQEMGFLSGDNYSEFKNSYTRFYFDMIKEKPMPALSYNIVAGAAVPDATLTITGMDFQVNAYKDYGSSREDLPRLNTLNYLCTTDNKQKKAVQQFDWNWVERSEETDFDGVISINRDNFLDYLVNAISPQLRQLDIITTVTIGPSASVLWEYHISDRKDQRFTKAPKGTLAEYTPLMSYSLDNPARGTGYNPVARINLYADFDYHTTVKVSSKNNVIKVETRCWVWLNSNFSGTRFQDEIRANIVDFTSVVKYELNVSATGVVSVLKNPAQLIDDSARLDVGSWNANMATVRDAIKANIQNALSSFEGNLQQAMNGLRAWVFPGGRTFVFKDVAFSNYQDLVAHIKYVDSNVSQLYSKKMNANSQNADVMPEPDRQYEPMPDPEWEAKRELQEEANGQWGTELPKIK